MIIAVGLESWIVQDGNYGDFEIGSEYRFALDFDRHDVVPAPGASHAIARRVVTGAEHEVQGRVVCVTDSCWVVDFGVPAFQESKPPSWAAPGQWFSGRAYIGIDPFFYFERLKDQPGIPDLFRHCRVHRILLETTPWTETTTSGGGK